MFRADQDCELAAATINNGPIYVILAVCAAFAGLALLFGAWRERIAASWMPVPAGWALLVVSGGFWVASAGPELGISLVFLATSAVAWVFVGLNRQQRRQRISRDATAESQRVSEPRSLGRHVMLFVLVVPLAGVAATLVAVALSLMLPVSKIDAMVSVLAVMPILWGCGAYWAIADSRIARPAVAMVLGSVLSAAVIYS